MKTVGVGVIGCGLRSEYVLRVMPGLGEAIRITACHDPNEKSVRDVTKKFAPEAKICASYRDLIERDDVDWVMIFSWNCFHREQAVAALEAGKHVFCEKPLATTLEDCLCIKRAHEASGCKFISGLLLRYIPHYRKIRETILKGLIGDKIISIEFNETLHFEHGGFIHGDWRRLERYAGTHLLEKCCHDMDMLQWMLGELPARVASFGGTDFFLPENRGQVKRVGNYENGREAYSQCPRVGDFDPFGFDKDIVDNQVAILEFPSGTRATFHTNCNTALFERRLYICGSEGTLRAELNGGTIELCRIGRNEKPQMLSTGVDGSHGGGDAVLGPHIVACMLEDAAPLTSLQDALTAAVTCFGIDQARTTGRVIAMQSYWDRIGTAQKRNLRLSRVYEKG